LIAFVAAAHPATSSGKNSITPSGCPSRERNGVSQQLDIRQAG